MKNVIPLLLLNEHKRLLNSVKNCTKMHLFFILCAILSFAVADNDKKNSKYFYL